MFKITYRELRSQNFRQAISKVAGCPNYENVKVSYNLSRLMVILERHFAETQKEWVKYAEEFLLKDEKGHYRFDQENQSFAPKEGISQEDCNKKIEAWLDKVLEVDRVKIKVSDLGPAKLSPADFAALDPILDEGQALNLVS